MFGNATSNCTLLTQQSSPGTVDTPLYYYVYGSGLLNIRAIASFFMKTYFRKGLVTIVFKCNCYFYVHKKKFKPARENKFYEKYVKNKKARKVCFKKM